MIELLLYEDLYEGYLLLEPTDARATYAEKLEVTEPTAAHWQEAFHRIQGVYQEITDALDEKWRKEKEAREAD